MLLFSLYFFTIGFYLPRAGATGMNADTTHNYRLFPQFCLYLLNNDMDVAKAENLRFYVNGHHSHVIYEICHLQTARHCYEE